jgi:hypothetical protein
LQNFPSEVRHVRPPEEMQMEKKESEILNLMVGAVFVSLAVWIFYALYFILSNWLLQ